MSDNPEIVDVLRGAHVESRHRGAIAVVDAAGKVVFSLGDIARPTFPRSAVKVIQALPLVESGAADAYGLTDAELALACSSHGAEARHVETAAAMLAKAGRTEAALECGAHWPRRPEDIGAIHTAGAAKPTALHNNCSGKHAGFVCLACHAGVDPAGYIQPDHFVQREVTAALADVTGSLLGGDVCAIDGCSIPTYAMPLSAIAYGFAKLANGVGLAPVRAKAARRLFAAVMAEPFMVAGTDRFCTTFMAALPGRVFVKTGAEGVFCGAIPELGLGIAIKCDDGASRAAEVAMAAVTARLLRLNGDPAVTAFIEPGLVNWNGIKVGGLRPAAALMA
jgi:L-asparaginase II